MRLYALNVFILGSCHLAYLSSTYANELEKG